jgi:arylsulfatase A-like enzyme
MQKLRLALAALTLAGVFTGCSESTPVTSDPTAVPAQVEDKRPNFLFIVADDLGFADISRLGSEIQTPNIDAIADNGILFTRFYAASMCAPTRAMLLTGVDNHKAGLGNMAEFLKDNQRGHPGYEGYLNQRVATLPELLQSSDYHTYMVGKWHLGYAKDQSPSARGFERSFALLDGGASHFEDMAGVTIHHTKSRYREDGELLDSLPEGFYSSRSYTDKLIDYMESNSGSGKPFFAYAAYTAPHWPIQAPDDVLDKYAGVYDAGYDRVRAERFKKIKELNLIPQNSGYPERSESVPPWESLSENEQAAAARQMEVYAAMVDDLDTNIGRLIAFLRDKEELQNTVIVFMSDNGSDSFSLAKAPEAIAAHARSFDNSLENIGRQNSFEFIGPKWANVGEAPFRLYKTMPTEGGIRVPAAIWYPALNGTKGNVNNNSTTVTDLVPTVLELAGIQHTGQYRGREVFQPDGRSLVPVLSGAKTAVRGDGDTIGIELAGRRAIIKGDWKIVRIPKPAGTDQWELFDLGSDIGEQVNLAERMPDKLAELIKDWDAYQAAVGLVLPSPGPLVVNAAPDIDH